MNQPIKNLDSGLSNPKIAGLPRMPHLKEKTASKIFPVGWKLYTFPETNVYKMVEIKFDNRFKNFAEQFLSEKKRNTGKFLTEFFKCLVMNLIEWDWDAANPKLDIAQSTYKDCLGILKTKNPIRILTISALDLMFPKGRKAPLPTVADALQKFPTEFFKDRKLRDLLQDLQDEYENLYEILNFLGIFCPLLLSDTIAPPSEENKIFKTVTKVRTLIIIV